MIIRIFQKVKCGVRVEMWEMNRQDRGEEEIRFNRKFLKYLIWEFMRFWIKDLIEGVEKRLIWR